MPDLVTRYNVYVDSDKHVVLSNNVKMPLLGLGKKVLNDV